MGILTDLKVRKAGPGVHGDGDGLYLRVKPSGAKSWVLRVQFQGKRQDIGLGGYPADRSLAEAREEAARLRKLARRGGNAIAERDREKVAVPTFAEAMDVAHKELSKGWTDKNAAAFKASLEQHVLPKIGRERVDQIGSKEVIAALASTWTDKPHLGKKLRSRILQVLSFSKARGWREMPLPDARELRDGLARQPSTGNFAAIDYRDAPSFFQTEQEKEQTAGRMALLFTILTAARSGEVRQARWSQIDLEARRWSRPPEIMKNRKRHVVTLSDAAIAVLKEAAKAFGKSGLVFPGQRVGSSLSDMTLSKVMRMAGRKETVHGFRSTFRDWAAERMPHVPAMVAEMALAHKVGDKTEQAYLRSDLQEMRQDLMQCWGEFLSTE